MQAYVARQALRYGRSHLSSGSNLLICTCVWALGEFGELLDDGAALLEDEEDWTGPPATRAEAAAALLDDLTRAQRSGEVRCPVPLCSCLEVAELARVSHVEKRARKVVPLLCKRAR